MDENSLEAYESIKLSLSPKQAIVFEALRNKPCTDKTLAKRLGWAINRITGRRGELVKKGLVKKMYVDQQDGRSATVWGVSL